MQLLRFFLFLFLFLFLGQFFPDLNENYIKNVGLHAYRLGLVLNRSWTSLRTVVFSGLSQKNWEDRDHWSTWTGYSLVWFSVPFQFYEPDLEALLDTAKSISIFIFLYNQRPSYTNPGSWLYYQSAFPAVFTQVGHLMPRDTYTMTNTAKVCRCL